MRENEDYQSVLDKINSHTKALIAPKLHWVKKLLHIKQDEHRSALIKQEQAMQDALNDAHGAFVSIALRHGAYRGFTDVNTDYEQLLHGTPVLTQEKRA